VTPDEFAVTYRPEADEVSAGTGIDAEVLLAQWGVETDWGNNIGNQCNLGNIRCIAGIPCSSYGFSQFPSLASFVTNCIATWHNGYYAAVLAARTSQAQLVAIGESPWDAGHYDDGSGPGSSIIDAFELIGGILTQTEFDAFIDNNPTMKQLKQLLAVFEGGPASSALNKPDGTSGAWKALIQTKWGQLLAAFATIPAGPPGPPGPAGTVAPHDHVIPANTTESAP
jgi:hypothetical protein